MPLPLPPQVMVAAGPPQVAQVGKPVLLDGSVFIPDSVETLKPYKTVWFNKNGQSGCKIENPDSLRSWSFFSNPGTYDVCLRVTFATNQTQEACSQIQIIGGTAGALMNGENASLKISGPVLPGKPVRIYYTLPEDGAHFFSVRQMQSPYRRVRINPSMNQHKGSGVTFWDGTDENGQSLAAGSYLLELNNDNGPLARIIVVVIH